ncbi:hypothetical protein [Streptomyces sp. CFMR 7]|uniref:hypothetical protein n=1 Tax=Streptomyces sp. CFMR 7 TaxID=1649184 RepID=UPI0006AD15E2|nr:hypothetical protein [Streptomyces sp. CFMR 7]ALC25686.1 hypothetical protein ABE83_00200 [Streptomyces sp. CFMR 7]
MNTTGNGRRPRAILRIRFHPAERTAELYGQLLTVVDGISSRVEPQPADWSAYADLTGALTYWGRDVEGLVAVLRLRLLALHGVRCSAGVGHRGGRHPVGPPERTRHRGGRIRAASMRTGRECDGRDGMCGRPRRPGSPLCWECSAVAFPPVPADVETGLCPCH